MKGRARRYRSCRRCVIGVPAGRASARAASAPAHHTERRAIRPANRHIKKRRPSTTWRWALQQLIHRGSGSTDSTMSSHPPRCGRRTFPLNDVFGCPMSRGSPPCSACDAWRHASRSRLARRSHDPEVMLAHLRVSAVHPRRPTGTCRPRASRLHVVVQNEPDSIGWNGKPCAHVATISGEANPRAGRRFMFATRCVAIRRVLILLSPSSMRPTH